MHAPYALSTQVEARWHWEGLGDLVNASGASFTDGDPAQSDLAGLLLQTYHGGVVRPLATGAPNLNLTHKETTK